MPKVLSLFFLLCCVGCSVTPKGTFKSGDYYFKSIRITSHVADSNRITSDNHLRCIGGTSR